MFMDNFSRPYHTMLVRHARYMNQIILLLNNQIETRPITNKCAMILFRRLMYFDFTTGTDYACQKNIWFETDKTKR